MENVEMEISAPTYLSAVRKNYEKVWWVIKAQ